MLLHSPDARRSGFQLRPFCADTIRSFSGDIKEVMPAEPVSGVPTLREDDMDFQHPARGGFIRDEDVAPTEWGGPIGPGTCSAQ